ncbi:MAG: hypothetical protein Q8P77_01570 [Candidatus Veblenbacteria bacterium]|nr:hypothetical protein [Candidatus Veblenbacteria bacterium]
MVFTPNHLHATTAVGIPPARRWFVLFVFMSLAAGVSAYLALTNAVATTGYEVQDLQRNLRELKVTSQDLEARGAQMQAFNSPETGGVLDGYVVVERIEYLASTPQVGVAVK